MTITCVPTFQGSGVLFAAIEKQFGWSRAVVSAGASLTAFTYMILGPVQGWLADRFGPARMILLGMLLGGIGLAAFSRITNPPTYYVTYMVLSIGIGIGGFTPAMTAVNAWLPHRRATGMAIVVGGSSLAALLIPAMAWGITAYGWRTTSLGVAFVLMVAAPILARIVARRPPSALPSPPAHRSAGSARSAPPPGFTPVQALRTTSFWAIAGSHAFANLAVAAVSTHIVLHLTDIGLSFGAAATVVPVFGGIAFASQIVGGVFGDRFDKRVASSALIALQGASMVLLAFSNDYLTAMLFAVLYGIGFGARTPMMHALRGEYFGPRSFGTILGLEAVPMALGMMISPVAVGWAFDVQGSYTTAFIVLASSSGVAALLMLLARPPVLPDPQKAA